MCSFRDHTSECIMGFFVADGHIERTEVQNQREYKPSVTQANEDLIFATSRMRNAVSVSNTAMYFHND